MRFDEFLDNSAFAVESVDEIDGFVVEVALPQDWERFDSPPGAKVWIWRADPSIKQFCSNAVLTMTRVDASLDAADVFDMLCDWQLQIVPDSHEDYRELTAAKDAPGVVGALMMHFETEFGTVRSSSQSRIISADQRTFIAQLTLTGLRDTPRNWASISLTVRPAERGGQPSTLHQHTPSVVPPTEDQR